MSPAAGAPSRSAARVAPALAWAVLAMAPLVAPLAAARGQPAPGGALTLDVLPRNPVPGLQSFRLLATGRTLVDELEYDVDPIDLHRLRGARLYTNLSNLSSSRETVFGDVSDRTLLIGASGRPPWLPASVRVAGFLTTRSLLVAEELPIDVDGDGSPEVGAARREEITFLDLNQDGTFDLRRRTVLELEDETTDRASSYLVAAAWDRGRWILGGRLAHAGGSGEGRSAAATLDSTGLFVTRGGYEVSTTRVELGDPFFERRESSRDQATFRPVAPQVAELGRFGDLADAPITELRLSAAERRGRDELRYDLAIFSSSSRRRIADTFVSAIDLSPDPDDAVIERSLMTAGYQLGDRIEADGIAIAFRWRRELGRTRDPVGAPHPGTAYLDAQFIQCGLEYRQADLDVRRFERRPFALDVRRPGEAGRTVVELYDTDASTDSPGDGFLQEVRTRGLINLNAGSRVRFGIGGELRYQRLEEELLTRVSERRVYRFEDGDRQPSDPDDFTETFRSAATAADSRLERITQGVVPVGLEVAITPGRRWQLRVGAEARIQRVSRTVERRIRSVQAPARIVERDDGTVEGIEGGEPVSFTSFRTSRVTVTQDTDLAYGLGYDAADYLTIDFLMFLDGEPDTDLLDLAFWRSLRLSFKLRF